ncbi:hypothetical protein FRC12_015259 [Ceratobasidium sp. 428]|nr:hypothetical protein FRC12_015259 [Ceratobasidium sp. 428]
MPAEQVVQSRRPYRPTPLPKAHYVVPKRLLSPFGVSELFDWSLLRASAHSGSSRSASSKRAALRRHYQCQR